MPCQIFLLSPASCGGERARILLRPDARSELALRLRSPRGAPLGEVFSFLSGLYFRAKLAYARAFARPPHGVPGTFVITAGDGLRLPDTRVDLATVQRYASVSIDLACARYRRPVVRDTRILERVLVSSPTCRVVLLGSIATGKYVDVLLRIFGHRILFPGDFVGRGDMSRGGLLLRCVDAGIQLPYTPVDGAVRHGRRPPRLERRK
jgi:hypothetical protein